MALRYVDSAAAGTGSGADWTNAYTTMTAAIAGSSAGDTYYVASGHAESTAGAVTLTFKGTAATPDRVISVNKAGSVPPVAADILAGASVTTTGANALNLRGFVYGYGITFNCGTGAVGVALNLATNAAARQIWEACAFNLVGTTSMSMVIGSGFAGALSRITLKNCTYSVGAVGQTIVPTGIVEIYGKPGSVFVTGATIPTNLISGGDSNSIFISGMDLSASGSGKTLVVNSPLAATPVKIVNCKLDANVTVAATPVGPYEAGVQVIGSGATGVVARNEWYQYQGTLTTETTIVRTGGATDGTTPHSWKIVTTANNERDFPFETFERVFWNTTLGSITLTINTVTDNVTLTDADAFVEVEYLDDASFPVASLITDANATVLTTPANQASSSETWTTTGLTTPIKQGLSVTITPAMVGLIRWRVKIAKVSTTVYVDPKPVIS